jgi:hypothetical protein
MDGGGEIAPGNDAVGWRIRKNFGRHGWFLGTVKSYNKTIKQYRVNYDDGDSEDLELVEIAKIRFHETSDTPPKPQEEAKNAPSESGSGHWEKKDGKRVWVPSSKVTDAPIPAKESASEELDLRADSRKKGSAEEAQRAAEEPLHKPAPAAGSKAQPAAKPTASKPVESPSEEDAPITLTRPRSRSRIKNLLESTDSDPALREGVPAVVAPNERTSAAKRGDKPAASKSAKKDSEQVEGKEAGKTGTAVTATDKPGAKHVAEEQVLLHLFPPVSPHVLASTLAQPPV